MFSAGVFGIVLSAPGRFLFRLLRREGVAQRMNASVLLYIAC
jgi:hypothetical protein